MAQFTVSYEEATGYWLVKRPADPRHLAYEAETEDEAREVCANWNKE